MSKIEKFIFRTNGGNTCDACAENNGKEFYDPKDIPNLPIHPNCSSGSNRLKVIAMKMKEQWMNWKN